MIFKYLKYLHNYDCKIVIWLKFVAVVKYFDFKYFTLFNIYLSLKNFDDKYQMTKGTHYF